MKLIRALALPGIRRKTIKRATGWDAGAASTRHHGVRLRGNVMSRGALAASALASFSQASAPNRARVPVWSRPFCNTETMSVRLAETRSMSRGVRTLWC
jgi:hypothetical protein